MNLEQIDLKEKVNWVWHETISIHRKAPGTRLASSLSPIDIFVALYYGKILHFNPKYPLSNDRDRCIISKGHGSICMYPILSDLGFFPTEELKNVCSSGSFLGGIPDPIIPGYETINGSLGHGLGVAAGIAFALKSKNIKNSVFVIVGDGELHEGAVWEAIMFSSHHQLDNMHLIIDNNRISMMGYTDEILSIQPLKKRIESFGWKCMKVDGHDVLKIQKILKHLKSENLGKPKALIANTIKGKGIPGYEDTPLSHVKNPQIEKIDFLIK